MHMPGIDWSRHIDNPNKTHLNALETVLRYLRRKMMMDYFIQIFLQLTVMLIGLLNL